MRIGEKVKRRREELKISQEELAKIVGYKHKSSVNKIEVGERDIPRKYINSFAKALNVSVEWLLACDDVTKKGQQTMAKNYLTDEQVEREIERLSESPLVKLAKKEERIRLRRRQYLYILRTYEKKGKELAESGITMEMLEAIAKGIEIEE